MSENRAKKMDQGRQLKPKSEIDDGWLVRVWGKGEREKTQKKKKKKNRSNK